MQMQDVKQLGTAVIFVNLSCPLIVFKNKPSAAETGQFLRLSAGISVAVCR